MDISAENGDDVTMDLLPYQVYNPAEELVLQSAESARYPKLVELALLEAGYTIRVNGRKITKTEIRKECIRN